ncbi:MAG: stalk domain-containing protein [Clostridia bacterium]
MKKFIISTVLCVTAAFGASAYADGIGIQLDGNKLACDVPPKNINDRVLVPVRAIFEALGAEVDWDGDSRTVFAVRNGEYIKMKIDENVIETGIINSDGSPVFGENITIDVPAQIIDDRTLVPVRAVSETLHANVDWDGGNQTVIINNPPNTNEWIYYASEHDYGKLYAIRENGLSRRKISDKSVYDIKFYNGWIYYISKADNMMYRTDGETEQLVTDTPVYPVCFEDNYVYYMERTPTLPENTGVLSRVSLDTLEKQTLTSVAIRYAEKHGNYIFYNEFNDDRLYSRTLDGSEVNTLSFNEEITLYPFNCYFTDDFVFVENTAWYSNIFRLTPDGSHVAELNSTNSTICQNQQRNTGKIVYINSDDGQNIYAMDIDGANNHKIADLDSNCFSVNVMTQWGDRIYYKNTFRDEVYCADLSGNSYGNYITYAKDVKVKRGKLFATYEGLYVGELDGSNMQEIFWSDVSDYKYYGDNVYVTAAGTGKLYKVGFDGSQTRLINEYITEWDCNFAVDENAQ